MIFSLALVFSRNTRVLYAGTILRWPLKPGVRRPAARDTVKSRKSPFSGGCCSRSSSTTALRARGNTCDSNREKGITKRRHHFGSHSSRGASGRRGNGWFVLEQHRPVFDAEKEAILLQHEKVVWLRIARNRLVRNIHTLLAVMNLCSISVSPQH